MSQQATVKKQRALSPLTRKVRKFKRDPKLFLADSKAYVHTRKTVYLTWAKLGSFAVVILLSLLIVAYFTLMASPRYVSQIQFVVKQNERQSLPLSGLAALAGAAPATRDAFILQRYLKSADMALALDERVGLKAHYQNTNWDAISRLQSDATFEQYVEYYQSHISVKYDELSEILLVEIQGFEQAYSLKLANTLLAQSQLFINQLGSGMVSAQIRNAEQQVNTAYENLKLQQLNLIEFQTKFNLVNPEAQGSALLSAVHQLEANIIAKQTELKSLQAYMHSNTAEVKSKHYEINALQQQLSIEKQKLVARDDKSLNKVQAQYKEVELNTQLAADLYQSALTSLEKIRAEALTNIKYLLIVQQPRLAEEQSYPRRLYSIATWFVVLLIIYLIGKLVYAIIKERSE